MPLPIGSEVVVRTLGNKRGVVIEASRDGRYRVRLEGVTVWCREDDLAPPPEDRKKKRTGNRRHGTADAAARDEEACLAEARRVDTRERRRAPSGRVDLHGLRVEEAIARTVDEIDRALLRGADRVEVVHGKGAGRIKDALHRHLATMPVVKAFELDQRNPGVTWVYF